MGRFSGYGYNMPFSGIFAWHGYIGLAIQIIIAIALIVGVIYLIKALFRKNTFNQFSGNSSSSLSGYYQEPIMIAKARLAKGEITKEEYEEIVKTLKE